MKPFYYFLFFASLVTALASDNAFANDEEVVPDEIIKIVGKRPPPGRGLLGLFWKMDALSYGGYGGSDVSTTNPAEDEQANDECRAGNPVIVSSGEKVESITDVVLLGQYPFSITREYSSLNTISGAFGPGWHSALDIELVLTSNVDGDAWPDYIRMGAGRKIHFEEPRPRPPGELAELSFQSFSGSNILMTTPNFSSWGLFFEDGQKFVFNSSGRLTRVETYSNGRGVNFSYSAGKLSEISTVGGRKLNVYWNTAGLVSKITDNQGNDYNYGYTNGVLTTVTYPDGTTHTYHYDSNVAHRLVGVSYNGQRYSWFTYDSSGRVTESRHANDIDKTTFSYGYKTTVVTNALGNQTTYTYSDSGKSRLTNVTTDGTPYCGTAVTSQTHNAIGQVGFPYSGNRRTLYVSI